MTAVDGLGPVDSAEALRSERNAPRLGPVEVASRGQVP